jgi:hypothetical protein
VTVTLTNFWDITPYSLVEREARNVTGSKEDGGTVFSRNSMKLLQTTHPNVQGDAFSAALLARSQYFL